MSPLLIAYLVSWGVCAAVALAAEGWRLWASAPIPGWAAMVSRIAVGWVLLPVAPLLGIWLAIRALRRRAGPPLP